MREKTLELQMRRNDTLSQGDSNAKTGIGRIVAQRNKPADRTVDAADMKEKTLELRMWRNDTLSQGDKNAKTGVGRIVAQCLQQHTRKLPATTPTTTNTSETFARKRM